MTPEKNYSLLTDGQVSIADTDLIYPPEKVSNPKPTTVPQSSISQPLNLMLNHHLVPLNRRYTK